MDDVATFYIVFPAHAGMFRSPLLIDGIENSFPRARGDVPHKNGKNDSKIWFSPRTRGCSAIFCLIEAIPSVFPAHAGMFREDKE